MTYLFVFLVTDVTVRALLTQLGEEILLTDAAFIKGGPLKRKKIVFPPLFFFPFRYLDFWFRLASPPPPILTTVIRPEAP